MVSSGKARWGEPGSFSWKVTIFVGVWSAQVIGIIPLCDGILYPEALGIKNTYRSLDFNKHWTTELVERMFLNTNDSNTVREVSPCFNLPFSQRLPSRLTTCAISCQQPWRGQQFCLVRDRSHFKRNFTLNLKKSRKGQTSERIHSAPTKRKCFTSWLCFVLVDFVIQGNPN